MEENRVKKGELMLSELQGVGKIHFHAESWLQDMALGVVFSRLRTTESEHYRMILDSLTPCKKKNSESV